MINLYTYPIINFEVVSACLPACLRACTTQSVYHSRRSMRIEQKSMDFRGRFRKRSRITGTQQTPKPLLLTVRNACQAQSASSDFARNIAGEHSERSPPSMY